MFITKRALPRRTFLRAMGTAVALPMLDAMVPALSALADTPAAVASRLGFIYMPNGVAKNSSGIDYWTPRGEGTGYELSQILMPLAPFRDRVIVEPITSRHDSPADPLFRHRVVYFFFRAGARYVPHDRLVLVDLTTQTVILQPVSSTPAHMSAPSKGGR